ncbi:MAG TPA: hypothetical protein VGG28_32295 [Kofleriaceae bacterium]
MRIAIALIAVVTSAAADPLPKPKSPLETTLDGAKPRTEVAKQLLGAFTDPVQIAGLVFADASCETRFGAPMQVAGADRAALATCIAGLGLVDDYGDLAGHWVAAGTSSMLVVAIRTSGTNKIAAFGPDDNNDAQWPTFTGTTALSGYHPSARVGGVIAKANRAAVAWVDVCTDAGGHTTSARITQKSYAAVFDTELLDYAKRDHSSFDLPPVEQHHKRIAACVLARVERMADID